MDAFKAFKFEELSKNPSLMFNFFYVNNDVFQKIDPQDMDNLTNELADY